jgi:transcriptional regulator with XRE-family HTH domain
MNTSNSVDINGEKIRTVREQKGLTQLYLATVVGVTTDTISRWENRRYPSIKLDNAKKLAEALEIPLEELLEAEAAPLGAPDEEAAPDQRAKSLLPPFFTTRHRLRLLLAATLVLGSISAATLLWFNRSGLQATRIMPRHTAPNQPFPVLIRISAPVEFHGTLLVRDELQGDGEASGILEKGQAKQFGKNPRWIGRIDNGNAMFLYLVAPGKKTKPEDKLTFSGDIITREGQMIGDSINGPSQVVIAAYHWADADQDYVISDDEILSAYETYSLPGDSTIDLSAVEELWLAGKYAWNKRSLSFEPAPAATGKE